MMIKLRIKHRLYEETVYFFYSEIVRQKKIPLPLMTEE